MPGQGVSKLQKNSPADASTGVIFILPQWGQSYFAQRGQSRVPEGVNHMRLFQMVYLLPNPCCREENNCQEIVEPVYLGIVNVDTD